MVEWLSNKSSEVFGSSRYFLAEKGDILKKRARTYAKGR